VLPFESCDAFDFSEPAKCGGCKCYLQLKETPTDGYLVKHDNPKCKNLMDRMTKAYELAKELENNFQIKHPLVEPPQLLDPNTAPPCLSEQLTNSSNFVSVKAHADRKKISVTFNTSKPILYMKNRAIPTPHFLVKSLKLKDPVVFVKNHVHNTTIFLKNFEEDENRIAPMLDYEPKLYFDFQVVLDSYGGIHHLDFDRAYKDGQKDPSQTMKARVLEKMYEFFYYVKKLVKLKQTGELDKYINDYYGDDEDDGEDDET
jgi:hypothetical protein